MNFKSEAKNSFQQVALCKKKHKYGVDLALIQKGYKICKMSRTLYVLEF